MKKINYRIIFTLLLILTGSKTEKNDWKTEEHSGYTLYYQVSDSGSVKEYAHIIDGGIKSVLAFFNNPYKTKFGVFIHPSRISIDNQWRRDWKMPDFKSECWMVASGVATRLDMISPRVWSTEACEHNFNDNVKTQQLITHELIHVFHGQYNPSQDFSDVTGLDWFVEGLATYASGQCDAVRMVEIKNAIKRNEAPLALDNFWKGSLKYGLSGSMVKYIDVKFGRNKLNALLKFTDKSELLKSLGVTEQELVEGWRNYIGLI